MFEQALAKHGLRHTQQRDQRGGRFIAVEWRRLAARRFEWRREITGKQETFLHRRGTIGNLRSGEDRMFGEHGRAQRRDDLVNDLLFRLPDADRKMAGDAERAGFPIPMGSPRLMLIGRALRTTRGAAHAVAGVFRLGRDAGNHIRRSGHDGEEQQ
jgi:hypothetical protein